MINSKTSSSKNQIDPKLGMKRRQFLRQLSQGGLAMSTATMANSVIAAQGKHDSSAGYTKDGWMKYPWRAARNCRAFSERFSIS